MPLGRRDRQLSLYEIAVQCSAGFGWQRNLTRLPTFPDNAHPMIATGVGRDVAEAGTDQFADAQAGRIREVQDEAQALRRRRFPAIRPLESVCNGTHERPLA